MELKYIIEMLWKRRWLVIYVFFTIFLTIVIGSLLITPWYTATAKVFLQRSTAASTLLSGIGLQGVSSGSASLAYSDTDRADYLALATLRPVAEKVISELNVKRLRTRARLMNALPGLKPVLRFLGVDVNATEKVITAEDLLEWPISGYLFPIPNVSAEQYESTDIIKIKGISTNPEQAMRIANAMAKAFVENEVKRIRKDFQASKDYIAQNMKHYNNEYTKALRALRYYKEREKTVNIDAETSDFISQISNLKFSQRDLYISLAETKTKYSPNHPAVIDIQNKIVETKRLIQEKMKKVFGAENMSADAALRELADKATNSPDGIVHKAQDGSSPNDVGKFNDDRYITGLPRKSYEYAQLNLAVTVAQDIYNSLLKYSYQVGIAEAVSLSNIYIVETGKTPEIDDSRHKYPRVWLNVLIAVFLGTVFGIGTGLLVEYMDTTIKTADDLKLDKAVTLLGRIPQLRKKESRLIDEVDPRSPLRELFRTIRNNIRFSTLDKPVKSLLVTSSIQGEGRSFIVSNIAISSVNEGKRVLIIDGDMRRPSMHSLFGLDNSTGLTSYLAGDASLESIQKQSRISGLSVITTGPIPPDPAKLVESKKMHQLLEDMKKAYDLVVVDSPPVFAVSDALVLGGWTDGTIIVAESGSTTRKLFTEVSEAIQKANIPVIGVILNKVDGRDGSYYKYYRT